ncbi:hypothetical protein HYDPIDRAFT_167090 [Hydnomerulius pinastri MD-312]|nr:hypothetical protein HYDPIDRAFT_167090 [Hydnomerulius pinastri MD-312]
MFPLAPAISPSISPDIMKGINAMPAPTSNKVPSFDGGTSELLEFFDYFEDLASACSLTDADKCKVIVRYVDKTTKRFWITLTGYENHDYKTFKDSILAQYPGAKKGIKYNRRDLELVVESPSNEDISTETEIHHYYRKFRPVAVWLVANKKISTHERDQYFWQGLPVSVRRSIDRRLELKNADYSRDEPTDYENVLEAGRFVLSDDAFDDDFDDPIAARLKSMRDGRGTGTSTSTPKSKGPRVVLDSDDEHEHESRKKDAPRDDHTKSVPLDQTALTKSQYDEVEELARKMHSLDIADASYSAFYTRLVCLAPAAAQAWLPPSSRQLGNSQASATSNSVGTSRTRLAMLAALLCYLCGGSHLLRDCPVAEEYIRAGRIIRDNGYLTFPDRIRIRRHPAAGNLKATIDERYGGPLTAAATATTTQHTEFKHDPPPHLPNEVAVAQNLFDCFLTRRPLSQANPPTWARRQPSSTHPSV